LCLNKLKPLSYFNESSIFTREQVNKGKPAPDLFLYSAKEMGNVTDQNKKNGQIEVTHHNMAYQAK
jgi:beta-phosphoglucomutase-like phosphatase (HAD superfamily)